MRFEWKEEYDLNIKIIDDQPNNVINIVSDCEGKYCVKSVIYYFYK
jgi:regulator of RNase E activity RraB